MRRAMKADSAIKSAPNKYHRLVVVMTTDADTCPKR